MKMFPFVFSSLMMILPFQFPIRHFSFFSCPIFSDSFAKQFSHIFTCCISPHFCKSHFSVSSHIFRFQFCSFVFTFLQFAVWFLPLHNSSIQHRWTPHRRPYVNTRRAFFFFHFDFFWVEIVLFSQGMKIWRTPFDDHTILSFNIKTRRRILSTTRNVACFCSQVWVSKAVIHLSIQSRSSIWVSNEDHPFEYPKQSTIWVWVCVWDFCFFLWFLCEGMVVYEFFLFFFHILLVNGNSIWVQVLFIYGYSISFITVMETEAFIHCYSFYDGNSIQRRILGQKQVYCDSRRQF